MPPIEELIAERTALLERLTDPSDVDIDAVMTRASEVGQEIEAHNQRVSSANAARAALMNVTPENVVRPGDVRQAPSGEAPAGSPASFGGHDDGHRLARRLTEAEGFDEYVKRGGKGTFSADVQGPETRTLLTSTNTTQVQPLPAILGLPQRPLLLADLIDKQTTSSPLLSYVQDTTSVAPGVAVEVTEGSAKPEMTAAFTIVNATVPTIAHWVQITRQALNDNQQLQGYIEGRLRYGLDYRLDTQIVNGDGSAPNMRGILATSGIQTYAPTSEPRILSLRHARTLARTSYYVPDGVALNPVDWEIIQTSRASGSGEFLLPGAPLVGPADGTIWGMRVVETDAVASGTAIVGSFRQAATLWDLQAAQLLITDSHASLFTSNILVLLAEMRIGLTVWRPAAFVKVTFGGTV